MKTMHTRRRFLQTTGFVAAGTMLAGNMSSEENVNVRIKIGQIGTGHAHADKTSVLRKLPDRFEFVGVAEDDPDLRKKAEKHAAYKDVRWMSSDELLALPDLRAVAVETRELECLPAALRCIRAGKHVHLDKPAGENLAEFRKLLDEAKAKKLVVQMGYMLRNSPAIQFCIRAVRDGLIGKVFDLDAAMSRYDNESARKRVAGFRGGIPFLLGSHLIDLAVILLGEPKKIESKMMYTRDNGCLDNGLITFEYSGGCFATLRSSNVEVEGFQRRHVTIRGDRGSIVVQPLEIKGNMSGGEVLLALDGARDGYKKGYQKVEMPPLKNRYEDQWIEFGKVIAGEMENPYDYEHDYIVQKILLEACKLI